MQQFDMGRVPPVTFGPGRIADVPDILEAVDTGGGPVMLIADTVLQPLGVTDTLIGPLRTRGRIVEAAVEVSGEPKEAMVDRMAARAREADVRAVIGLGGGAAMDAAKLVAAIAPSGRPAADFALCAKALPGDGLPAIAIPTTAGTGSEVTRTSIVSDGSGRKLWYWGEALMFAHAVLDPELTLTLPAHVTAWTGIDAVAHALEAVTSRSSNEAGRLYGLRALAILHDALPAAVVDGTDIDARSRVQWASLVAGLALHNCNTHLGHNISHALGSLRPVHHGLATGLGLEIAFPWLVEQPGGQDDYARAACALGGLAQADALPDRFSALMRAVGIGPALAGIDPLEPGQLAAEMKAPANRSMADNAATEVRDADLDMLATQVVELMRRAA